MRAERGYLVAGRYELAELIALGGMGEVWRARDLVLGRPVAVKLLRTDRAADPSFVARFRDEARHAAGLSHPNIATVHDYGEQDGWAFLVMELVEGESLAARLARTGPAAPAAVVAVIGQVGEALAVAHRAGIVHRDVKPANILLTPDGRVKLTDFGIAKAVGGAGHTASGVVVGTARYLSPEQATGAPTSPASDVYALGLITYEMLAGRAPFTGTNDVALALAHVRELPPALPAGVPAPLAALVGASLAKDPSRRPADATAFLDRLRVAAAPAGPGPGPDDGGLPADPPVTATVVPPLVPGPPFRPTEPAATAVDHAAHASPTTVAPPGFGASAGADRGSVPPGPGPARGAVLGDLPARHRARRRATVTAATVVALAVLAAGGWFVARAVDGDDPAGAIGGDGAVTTVPAAATTPAPTTPAPTTAAPTTAATTTTAAPTTTTAVAPTTTVPPTTTLPPPTPPTFDTLQLLVGQDADEVIELLEFWEIDYEVEDRRVGPKERGKVLEVSTDGPLFDDGTVYLVVGTGGGRGGKGPDGDGPGDG